MLDAFNGKRPGGGWSQVQRALDGHRVGARCASGFGGLVLGIQSLPYGYASPGGNEPLAFSGRLTEQAPRRLMETARFVHGVCRPGQLRVGGDAFKITVKVRVMHAQVRRLLWDSGKWNRAAWGEPLRHPRHPGQHHHDRRRG